MSAVKSSFWQATSSKMYFPHSSQLLTLTFLKYALSAIALPATAALNSSVIPINGSAPLSATDFSRDVALGIAAADRAYPSIVPRLYQVAAFVTPGESALVPFYPNKIVLALQLRFPKACSLSKRSPGQPWEAPREADVPGDFRRPAFDWDRLPMTFEEAQQKLFTAKNIPNDQKIVNWVSISVLSADHSSEQARSGDLVFRFTRMAGPGNPYSSVIVNGENGKVFSANIGSTAEEAVQTS